MIHKIDPRQKRLFDPYEGLITPAGHKIITEGWQALFRHILLEKMPVTELSFNKRWDESHLIAFILSQPAITT